MKRRKIAQLLFPNAHVCIIVPHLHFMSINGYVLPVPVIQQLGKFTRELTLAQV